eukprot:TRINITY_DN15472_c0_g1_i3.p1 TRINITY_DN15472_c0_g1~~TRINITY_DN15472_c0_g1_i3.p1  ORF type:complete len:184 (-),score=33.34 TRINITY_DN15472_c0_g1_i3:194-745(-)
MVTKSEEFLVPTLERQKRFYPLTSKPIKEQKCDSMDKSQEAPGNLLITCLEPLTKLSPQFVLEIYPPLPKHVFEEIQKRGIKITQASMVDRKSPLETFNPRRQTQFPPEIINISYYFRHPIKYDDVELINKAFMEIIHLPRAMLKKYRNYIGFRARVAGALHGAVHNNKVEIVKVMVPPLVPL